MKKPARGLASTGMSRCTGSLSAVIVNSRPYEPAASTVRSGGSRFGARVEGNA